MASGSYRELFSARMMYGMQYIQQTIVGIDGSEARFFGYVADNSEEMEPYTPGYPDFAWRRLRHDF